RGAVSADFVGLARSHREKAEPTWAHVHFNGAGGNVAAGKYNDGSEPNRAARQGDAGRLGRRRAATGGSAAWERRVARRARLAAAARDTRRRKAGRHP